MSGATTELNLSTAVDTDDNADYLTLSLANSLRTVDGLFNNITGHTHGGAHQGGPVTLATGSVPGTALANGSVTNAKLASDTARANLLTNGGFEIWQRGTGPFTASGAYTADRWPIGVAGTDAINVQKLTSIVDVGSLASAFVTFTLGSGAGASNLTQTLRATVDGNQLAGRTLTLSMRVYTATANAVRIALVSDGTGGTTTYSSYQSGTSNWQTLSVTATIPTDATIVYAAIRFSASCSAYIDNAMLVVGSQYADYAPLHPADDLARCLRYYETIGVAAGGEVMLASVATAASQFADISFPYKAIKPVSPTVTKVGTWGVTNCGQPTVSGTGFGGCRLSITASAAGQFYSSNSLAGTNVTVESNP